MGIVSALNDLSAWVAALCMMVIILVLVLGPIWLMNICFKKLPDDKWVLLAMGMCLLDIIFILILWFVTG